ncbi:siderophore-interacting protein [Salinisphaera sp. Q1T1-3]|uniref:siderophore-interacting protein n=1 Tax=Salinisphaera sp. Q1T1-3 TaxID=2321229 RepID=UPI000E711DBE|nr:siderophore-interacting protein [Salinisphaera sp. Q1T1-3]RJS93351.1 siderophore-interacting protein [Salinisphaera sp. Q1T1-3]
MPNRPAPRRFTVLDNRLLTPGMRRITLGGDGMADFPAEQESAYVKLHFAQAHSERPLLRTYTIRHQRADAVDIDFVRHTHGGPASRWAEAVEPGATIDIGGPGPAKRVDATADWFLLVGDMTALPAIGANIETLPREACGHAVIEVHDEADIQPLDAPAGLTIDWRINPSPGRRPDLLVDAVRELAWRPGRPAVWAACEFSGMRRLRTHFREERGLPREALYISSYWQLGADETDHKAAKRADAQETA